MSRTFRRHGDRIRADLDRVEVDLLRQLRDGLRESLEDQHGGDPVIERLFPSAVTGDDEADDELRRLIHDDLLRSKLTGLDELVAILDRAEPHRSRLRVELEPDEAMLMLGVLNDLRLAIGARVGVEEIERDSLQPDDPRIGPLAVMDHLAGLQEQLLEIIDPESVRHYEEGHDLDEGG